MDPLEIEVKIRCESAEAARRALQAAGAVESRPRHFEENRIYDTPAGDLRGRSAMLRVRSASDGAAAVTFKEKVETTERAKVRRELESPVGDPEVLAAILDRCGFVIIYRYQKHRTVFRLGEATIDLDETPMGCFLEIEGTPAVIASTAAAIGARESDFIVEDYRTLHREWLSAKGLPPGDMVFDPPRGGAAAGA